MAKKKSIDELIALTLVDGPKGVSKAHVRISIDDAEELSSRLRIENELDIMPYDFPRVYGIWYEEKLWPTQNPEGVPYARIATKQLLCKVAEEEGLDYRTIAGFRELLRKINSRTFMKTPINRWGTVLATLLNQSGGSYIPLIIDIVDNDIEFSEIKKAKLQPADFPYAPQNIWVDKEGRPTETSRQYTVTFIEFLANKMGVNPYEVEGFSMLLPRFTTRIIKETQVNVWGKTLAAVFTLAYKGCPSDQILDAVRQDQRFSKIIEASILPIDFMKVAANTWIGKDGQPTETAVYGAKLLIEAVGRQQDVDPRTLDGFLRIIPSFTENAFNNVPIDVWGRKLGSNAFKAFNYQTGKAAMEVIEKYDEYANLRGIVTQDMFGRSKSVRAASATRHQNAV